MPNGPSSDMGSKLNLEWRFGFLPNTDESVELTIVSDGLSEVTHETQQS